jgi:hypothetical protein
MDLGIKIAVGERSYKRVGTEWDTLEEAATRAQGKPEALLATFVPIQLDRLTSIFGVPLWV